MLSNKFTFFLFVIIPTAIGVAYYGHFASDRYISESRYIVEGSKQPSVDVLGLVTGFTGMASSGTDSLAVQNYIISHDFLGKLQPRYDLISKYSDTKYDWWARIDDDATQEELLKYWDFNIINISFDSTSGISTLEVTAFQPEAAREISKHVLSLSEEFINSLSTEAKSDALVFAQDEVVKAETKLLLLRAKISDLNKSEKVISAEQNATAEQGIVAALKEKLAVTEAEYKKLTAYMETSSLKVRLVKNEINSIKKQIRAQQANWDNAGSGKTVTSVVLDTGRLKSELAFAEKVYITAIGSLKQAQIEASQKQRYLDVIVEPHLPDEALEPDRLYSSFSVFLASLMIWGILSLIISSIKDHMGWS